MLKYLTLAAVTYGNPIPESCFTGSQYIKVSTAGDGATDIDWLVANYDTTYKLRRIISCTS
jgi:hypothetical protein